MSANVLFRSIIKKQVAALNNIQNVRTHTIKGSPPKISENGDIVEETEDKNLSPRMKEFKKKLREVTPIEHLGEQVPKNMQVNFPEWPNKTNPHTGEVNGPTGPEPTRYGDWERKGRCSDF